MLFAEVLLNLPLDKSFTYAVPEDLEEKLRSSTGYRVEVNFRNRKTIAYIVGTTEEVPTGNYAVKNLIRLLDDNPLF